MSQEIEALASQVEELTSELINERNKNTTLEKSLQGPPMCDVMTQTEEKGNNRLLFLMFKSFCQREVRFLLYALELLCFFGFVQALARNNINFNTNATCIQIPSFYPEWILKF